MRGRSLGLCCIGGAVLRGRTGTSCVRTSSRRACWGGAWALLGVGTKRLCASKKLIARGSSIGFDFFIFVHSALVCANLGHGSPALYREPSNLRVICSSKETNEIKTLTTLLGIAFLPSLLNPLPASAQRSRTKNHGSISWNGRVDDVVDIYFRQGRRG